jgi:thiosulfate/3-mercaptopyruvate sulfurtransferase
MTELALPVIIDSDDLARRLQDDRPPQVIFVGDEAAFAHAHIPGAGCLAYASLNHAQPPAAGLLPPMAVLSTVLGDAGIEPQHPVVAYDDSGGGRASRLVWTLNALGHWDAAILDGGLHAWIRAGHASASGLPDHPSAPPYPAALRNPEVVADRAYIEAHRHDPAVCIVDARTSAEYSGADVRAARGGHIPGAVNLDWADNRDPDDGFRLRPAKELEALYRAHGVTPDREIITHCQTHHRSSLSYVVLRHLGFDHVRGLASTMSAATTDPGLSGGITPTRPLLPGPSRIHQEMRPIVAKLCDRIAYIIQRQVG